MKIINIDLSNITIDNAEYDSSLLLNMVENKEDLCFLKTKKCNGIGYRYINDDVKNLKYLEFIIIEDFYTNSYRSIVADVNKNRAIFHELTI